MIDPKLLYEDKNCKGCNDKFSSIAFNYCMKCTEKSLVKVHDKFKDKMKWRRRKKITYELLIMILIFIPIGIFINKKIELISLFCFIIGTQIEDISNFLCKLF